MYGKSVNRETGVALVLVAALSGLLAAAVVGETADAAWTTHGAQQEVLPVLPEIVVTATRLQD